jgi:translation elongation factor EF-Ts
LKIIAPRRSENSTGVAQSHRVTQSKVINDSFDCSLLDQPFIKEASQTIAQLIASKVAKRSRMGKDPCISLLLLAFDRS